MSMNQLPDSILKATTNLHFVFFPIACGLFAFLCYLYLAHPRKAAAPSQPQPSAPQWHDPRPRSLLPLLIAAAFTGMLSHVLNALYVSQSLPPSSNFDLHIRGLTLTPWLVLMTSATILQHFPIALLVAAILIVLHERYHALLRRVNDKGDWVPGPFMGWVGKEGASMAITYMLFLFPIASRLTFSLALAFYDSPYFLTVGTTPETADYSSWERMINLTLIFENCRALFLGIAAFDIAVSSYCLSKEGRFWGVSDAIATINFYLVTPLLIATALQTVISTLFVTAAAPSNVTLSSVDLASISINATATYLIIVLFTFLFCSPARWDIEIHPDSTVVRLGPIRLSEGDSNTFVDGDYLDTPKSVMFRHTI